MNEIEIDFSKKIQEYGEGTSELVVDYRNDPRFYSDMFMGISFAGISDIRPGYMVVRPSAPELQVLACVSGHARVLVRGKWQTLNPGEAYINAPDQLVSYYMTGSRWKCVWAKYELSTARKFAEFVPEPYIRKIDIEAFYSVVNGLYREYCIDMVSPITLQWLKLLDMTIMRIIKSRSHHDDTLQNLWRKVESNLNHHWSIDELSGEANVCSESLRQMCLRETGLSPMKYVTRLRMRRACQLLTYSNTKLATLARMVGYENQFAFSIAFRKWSGMPPSTYKKRKEAADKQAE